ncbi:MAG: M61 family metallopeptidase [Sedimentisphaerales bacterium]|nr:M61 family metallopeptidase [Sedimentisphaerales bacterium]
MKHYVKWLVLCALLLGACPPVFGRDRDGTLAFAVSMERPSTHYYHVVLRCEGLKGATQDFKMPAWTPGYYQIMDHARNVVNFRAEDGQGRSLAWTKTAKNTWRVRSDGAPVIVVSYDVYAFARSVADCYLDDSRAFISPTGLFMHVAGLLDHPATVTIETQTSFSQISTGLDPVEKRPNTFSAPNFDVLYDCPIMVGNQEIVSFEVQSIPHTVAITEPGDFDREKLVSVLKRMVEAAVSIIGDIPYRHYTFIMMGPGRGGLEHQNSMAVFTELPDLDDPGDYQGWLGFIAHEFFHLYNVKAIRPIALGPFDYDRENYANLLWLSEGGTVYYQNLILNRAGFMSREDCLEQFQRSIANYENIAGHEYQSATQASFDVWLHFLRRGGDSANTTISYYDKGAALCLLLDLKIRHETQNRRSLDDVMRTLYQTYFRQQNRGFTDREFRQVCETIAGGDLSEFFDVYASTTAEIDYRKYLAYGGLQIDVEPKESSGAYLGADVRDQDGKVVVTAVRRDSPAAQARLSVEDEIVALDGERVTSSSLREMLESRRPGETTRVLFARRDKISEIKVVLGQPAERSFAITELPNPDELQAEILNSWLQP